MLLLSHILVKLALGKSMANVDEHEEHEYAGGNPIHMLLPISARRTSV
jgi:hypothetical protein